MNSGSKIGFNKASLLSLKAELARKNEEASRSKASNQTRPTKPLAKQSKSASNKSDHVNSNTEKESHDEEVSKTKEWFSSMSALKAKAELYDKFSQNPEKLHEDASFLVDFSKKSESSSKPKPPADTKEEDEDAKRVETDSDEYDAPSDPEDDWVEYTDCLGRTRRCLRRDLAELKAQDAKLYESTKKDSPPRSSSPAASESRSVPVGLAAPDLFSDDMRREQQRQKWEDEEEKIRSKPDVHYQDVLFNEARQHGVGYFAFSTDEAERRSQQAALKTLRTETEKQQAATNAARQRRAQLLNKRLRAAHNRKRAKDGLPPLADDEELPQTERPPSPPPEPEPPQIHLAADPEKRGEKQRPNPTVRPWDIGKEGVVERPVMTQEEWVNKKRKERPKQFAPPMFYEDRNARSFDSDDLDPQDQPKGLYFTSKRKKKERGEERYRKPMEDVEDYTVEEVDVSYVPKDNRQQSTSTRKGAEIPPPATMEYFGPSDKTLTASRNYANASGASRVTADELENSISAGLSFLRQQQEEKDKQRNKGMLDIL